jgi:hypothetical protein
MALPECLVPVALMASGEARASRCLRHAEVADV